MSSPTQRWSLEKRLINSNWFSFFYWDWSCYSMCANILHRLRKQTSKSLIRSHLNLKWNTGLCCWIFYNSLGNYGGRLRIMQHVMLTPAPYSRFLPQRKTTGMWRWRGGWHEGVFFFFSFLCLNVKLRAALAEMWQITAMWKANRLAHTLICQVRWSGSVGAAKNLLVFLCTWFKVHVYNTHMQVCVWLRLQALCQLVI